MSPLNPGSARKVLERGFGVFNGVFGGFGEVLEGFWVGVGRGLEGFSLGAKGARRGRCHPRTPAAPVRS